MSLTLCTEDTQGRVCYKAVVIDHTGELGERAKEIKTVLKLGTQFSW